MHITTILLNVGEVVKKEYIFFICSSHMVNVYLFSHETFGEISALTNQRLECSHKIGLLLLCMGPNYKLKNKKSLMQHWKTLGNITIELQINKMYCVYWEKSHIKLMRHQRQEPQFY